MVMFIMGWSKIVKRMEKELWNFCNQNRSLMDIGRMIFLLDMKVAKNDFLLHYSDRWASIRTKKYFEYKFEISFLLTILKKSSTFWI